MTKLDAFRWPDLGRLKESSGQRMRIDEVRIYKRAAFGGVGSTKSKPVSAK
jgi:hypothetical protein